MAPPPQPAGTRVALATQPPPPATPTSAGGHGWLGLQMQAVTPEQAGAAGLDPKHPSGGIVVRFDGKTIHQPADLASDTPPGKTVDVGILRAGAHATLQLTVGTAPAGAVAGAAAPEPASVFPMPSPP